MPHKPTTIAIATYADVTAAGKDYDAVRAAKRDGAIDHLAISVIEKTDDGSVQVDRHDSTAKHLALGGGVVGGLLAVVAPPIGFALLAAPAAAAGAWAGAGGLVGHFWKNVPKEAVNQLGEVLENGHTGLVIVAVNPDGADIGALLANAEHKVVQDGVTDPEGALEQAFETAAD